MKRFIWIVFLLSLGCASKPEKPTFTETEPDETEPYETTGEPEDPEESEVSDSRPEGTIDLGFKGKSGKVKIQTGKIDGRDPDEPPIVDAPNTITKDPNDGLDWSCETVSDCGGRGLPRKKTGSWSCEKKSCVFNVGHRGKADKLP